MVVVVVNKISQHQRDRFQRVEEKAKKIEQDGGGGDGE